MQIIKGLDGGVILNLETNVRVQKIVTEHIT
jgi:hypothetical protein